MFKLIKEVKQMLEEWKLFREAYISHGLFGSSYNIYSRKQGVDLENKLNNLADALEMDYRIQIGYVKRQNKKEKK